MRACRRGPIVALGVALAAALAPGSAPAATLPPLTPPALVWTSFLPALGTHTRPQPHGVYGCRRIRRSCLTTELRRLDALRLRLGCDHRAVFTTTYELLTRQLVATLDAHPRMFRDRRWLTAEDAVFANMYFRSVGNYARGRTVPGAWRIAFETATSGDANALQDMLLGINAHVQRDMPYMIASVGTHTRRGVSHKPDHDAFNRVLNAAFSPVLNAMAARFDPLATPFAPVADPLGGLAANAFGSQLVEGWREGVWRNAERLLAARTPAERRSAEAAIELNATATAETIRALRLPPGYRVTRDAFCATHNRGAL